MLDEATSNLDRASDDAIQQLLRSEFRSTTLMTIAHRLGTVIDYHKILCMGDGRVLEHGEPAELLDQPSGVLAALANALGDGEMQSLRKRALDSAKGRADVLACPSTADVVMEVKSKT